jgi:ADP-dependent NAD(P)H-hydrate dehydratase / NAD(P)H-hydrate epimerase
MDTTLTPTRICENDARSIPWPNANTHKHNRGRLAVIAGGALQTGAARLAARAGQRMGAGWVTLFGGEAACNIMAHHETSILIAVRDPHIALSAQIADFHATIIGPAFGLTDTQGGDVFDVVKNYGGGLLLDADALHLLAGSFDDAMLALKARPSPAVLTPHSGEFSRLFGAYDEQEKLRATRDAAVLSGCIVVHKGAITCVCGPGGEAFFSDIPAPFLSTAGTGDVLGGMIGGLLAQGMDGMAACKAAVWLHSTAGQRLGLSLIAEDIIEHLPSLLRSVYSGNTGPVLD